VEEGLGRLVAELVVHLLVEDQHLPVHVEDADVIRALRVILDETGDTARPLIPTMVAGSLGVVDLNGELK